MEPIWTVVLGALQGATEFLPVSSSGHLAAGQLLLAKLGQVPATAEQPLVLEIILHLATLLAVLVFYRRAAADAVLGAGRALAAGARGRFRAQLAEDDGANLALAVVLATVPTGVIGIALGPTAERISRSPLPLGVDFLALSLLLLASRSWPGGSRRLDWKVALVVGVVQGIAALPAISRSGSTIAAGLALGLDREEAARFSFLLAVPAILGAAVVELDAASLGAYALSAAYLAGFAAAFVVGLAALALLVRVVRGGRLWLFAPYVAAVGIATLVFLR